MANRDSYWNRNNINRETPVGIDIAQINSMGKAPWEDQTIGNAAAGSSYVIGEYCDEGPLSALLWADIRQHYARLRFDWIHAAWFELDLLGVPQTRISKMFDVSQQCVQQFCARAKSRIENAADCGLITVIVEECGWSGLKYILNGK